MKVMKYFILILVLTGLFFLIGCNATDSSQLKAEGNEDAPPEDEDTGISDVFEDTGSITPPAIPI